MFRIIILLLISIRCINSTFSQTDLNSRLLDLEYCVYNSENDTIKNRFIIQKVKLYLINEIQNEDVLTEVKRINLSFIEDSLEKSNLLWNSILIAHLNNDPYFSLYYLNQYEIHSKDSTIETQLLKTLIYSQYNNEISTKIIQKLMLQNSDFKCLECLTKINDYELKHSTFFKRSSYFIPGFGMCLNGDLIKGSTSLMFNTTTFFVVKWLFTKHLYINMLSWGSNLFVKFYLGNIKLTQKLIDEKKNRIRNKKVTECSISISSILDRYPLRFKFN